MHTGRLKSEDVIQPDLYFSPPASNLAVGAGPIWESVSLNIVRVRVVRSPKLVPSSIQWYVEGHQQEASGSGIGQFTW
ncbi:hypothetical protein MYCTH_2308419 [Thermothelomyces thermophilus ATCC 42464]|uniref:Uncharacterized protein n=1 Tax=Thermothelomyces thermophilus (strain ATCC 42464 / BCRC 31852 / DSM 1799) TaxID=573729 RepID=G2QJT4_THET4|nr:uncharacterized protein MYCTH_2308419 [Thermothelomyces thermophilus ATCC 42464]AEO59840.1 hypothetical protein MYCTH_2308419 [Thermothelomyces thermophilus ATCC 42464]